MAGDDLVLEVEELEPLIWTVRLGKENASKMALVLAAAVFALSVGLAVFHSALFGLAGFAIILASTSEVWLGVRYRLDRTGAQATSGFSVTKVRWEEVKAIRILKNGIHVSSVEEGSRLTAFRGVMLLYGQQNEESLLCAINRLGGEDVRRLG